MGANSTREAYRRHQTPCKDCFFERLQIVSSEVQQEPLPIVLTLSINVFYYKLMLK